MNPALAGVVVPTVFLIVLAAVPYLDRTQEGQGTWFGTLNAVRITIWSGLFSLFGTVTLILLDSGKHAEWYEKITGAKWLGDVWLGEKSVKYTDNSIPDALRMCQRGSGHRDSENQESFHEISSF